MGGAITINIGGSAQQFTQAAGQASNAANAFAGAATAAGTAADHAFDEIAAGAAAMARIEAAINAAAAAALNAGHSFDSLESNIISTITPLNTLEQRLQDIRDAIGRSATVQGSANLGAQYEVINRNLAETRARVEAATQAAVGLSRAFNTAATATTAMGAAMNRLAPATRPVLTNLTVIPPAANAAAASLARLRGSSGQAGAALTDVSRIIQDAPYGIIGIGNNITQLSESFGRLRGTAGSTGAAFRQLFTSAGGFGGIGLAISLITTAFTFASVGFSAWTRGMGASKKAAEEAKKATDEFVKSLKSVDSIVGQATGGVQGQITQVQALASVITNTNNSYEQRKRALQDLQQINKAYFGDLKLEESQMGLLTSSVEEYTKALANQAIVKGFENEISRVSTELFTQETALKKFEKTFLNAKSRLSTSLINIGDTEKTREGLAGLVVETEDAEKAFVDQSAAVNAARGNLNQLIDGMKAAVVTGLGFADMTNTTAKATKAEDATLKSLRKELSGYERQLKDIDELRKQGALPISAENDALALQLKIFETLGKIDAREVAIKAKPNLEINPKVLDLQIGEVLREFGVRSASKPAIPVIVKVRPIFSTEFSPADVIAPNGIPSNAFDGVIKAIQDNATIKLAQLQQGLAESIQNTIIQGVVDGLASVGNTLGEAVAGIFSGEGVGQAIAAGAESLLKIIGGVLQDVGKQLIVTSQLVVALKAALKSIFANPAAGLGVGIALVALGGLLKSIKIGGTTPGFADGGIVPGGQILVGERGPEIATLPAGSSITPLSPFQETRQPLPSLFARGDDIYLVYNRTAGRRRRV